ncbi:hypothetical protein BKN38_09050 [Helicobacter sp. CLO-3]|uniref:sensor histidine kinase n=1 Tax=unclassified Helicobacter TaxID=2593540 RepID=UPI000805C389|nr:MULTISPECIES: HAMP domain-containing sensor histidine kinase [unclassified Helicobacter]OBV28903.1 hypothetical protein BA723_07645 [Helicobacter sp. CLO-3]OHU81414.1 hypothetical protein BKN38_09050 [Helicobacter sp. CLO-3]
MGSKFNATIFKILALYLGTSTLFLGFIFFVMYQKGLHDLRTQQMVQMRNNYIQIATHIYEHKPSVDVAENARDKVDSRADSGADFKIDSRAESKPESKKQEHRKREIALATAQLDTIASEISTPFAIIDSDDRVIFSTIDENLQAVLEMLENERFAQIGKRIFVDMRQSKSFEHMITHPPFNFSKRPKEVFRYFESLRLRVILQGEAIDTIEVPFLSQDKAIDALEKLESIHQEKTALQIEIIAYLLCSLLIMGVVAYILMRLSFRPIAEQIRTLERFIKDTTHEINTPLSVILMSVQKFDTKELGEANKKRLNHIKLSAQNLHHLYQNLIFLNFYNAKSTSQNIDMKALINERVEYFSTLLAQKSISVKSALAPAQMHANIDEIAILLDNLLSNAIKYNHKGGSIEIVLESSGAESGAAGSKDLDSGGAAFGAGAQSPSPSQKQSTSPSQIQSPMHCKLIIKDSGYGIDSAIIERIFERYTRFNEDQGGFGIGLNLVREIAKRYDIQIRVQSEKNKGSEFILSWNFSGQLDFKV